ncbi:MAG: YCF48-related protein [Dokdonella sp.]
MRISDVFILWAALVLVLACPALRADESTNPEWTDPVKAAAEIMPRADRALLLDIVRSKDRIIAIGERGNILFSGDGKSWTQAQVPTRATLTAIAVNGDHAWAAGHDGVILRSDDRGESWALQRSDPLDSSIPPYQRDPRQGSPLLDIMFVDAERGYAVGAYNLMLETRDGGASWNRVSLQQPAAPTAATSTSDDETQAADNPESAVTEASADSTSGEPVDRYAFSQDELALGAETDPHLNGIARTGSGAFFVVAERGSAYRSRDDGASWQRLKLPYDGSMFGVIGYEGEHVLVYGLRGNVFESSDLGDHWQRIETGTEFSLVGGAALGGTGAVLVGANGTMLARRDGDVAFTANTDLDAGAFGNILPLDDSRALVVGENGVNEVVIP